MKRRMGRRAPVIRRIWWRLRARRVPAAECRACGAKLWMLIPNHGWYSWSWLRLDWTPQCAVSPDHIHKFVNVTYPKGNQ